MPIRNALPALFIVIGLGLATPACVNLDRPAALRGDTGAAPGGQDRPDAGPVAQDASAAVDRPWPADSTNIDRATVVDLGSADISLGADLPRGIDTLNALDAPGPGLVMDLGPVGDATLLVDQTVDQLVSVDLPVLILVDAPGIDVAGDLPSIPPPDMVMPPPDMAVPALLLQGAACTAGPRCASGFCSDGRCCDSACNGACERCNGSVLGQCIAVPAGTACGAPAQCNNGQTTAATTCNGAGQCFAATTGSCGAYDCMGTGCRLSCTTATDCAFGNSCTKTSSQCQPLSGLVLWWKLDEASGPTAADSSGQGNNGTWDRGPVPSTDVPSALSGRTTRSLGFSRGLMQAVETPLSTSLKPATLTMSAWFKIGSIADKGDIIAAGDSYVLRAFPDSLEVIKRVANTWRVMRVDTTSHINTGWHHFAGVISATHIRLYLDGVLKGETPDTAALLFDLRPALVVGRHGNYSNDFDFNGLIDDVRIYNRALTDDEVSALSLGR